MSSPMDDVNGLLDYGDPEGSVAVPAVGSQTEPAPLIPAPAIPAPAETVVPIDKSSRPAPPAPAAPAAVEEDEDDEDDDEDVRHPAVYAARRALLKTGLIALVALMVLFVALQMGSNPFSPSTAPQQEREDAVAAPPTEEEKQVAYQRVQAVIVKAQAHQAEHLTFVGFTSDGARVASSESVFVISMVVDGRCYYGGVVPGQVVPVLFDETSQACTDEMIVQTQASLDAQMAQVQADHVEVASMILSRAVEAVQYYAANNFVGGTPSFDGIRTTSVDGVQIVDSSSDSVVLQARAGENCLSTTVTVDSASEPTTTDCQGLD